MSGPVRVAPAPPASEVRAAPLTFAVFLTYAFWILTVYEFDWYVSQVVGGPFYRIPTVMAPVLGLIALTRGKAHMVYVPMLLFVGLHLGASVLAENAGFARDSLRFLLFMVLLLMASVVILDAPARMIVIFKLYLLSFVWFGVQGVRSGLVWWHPLLANEDSYGPLMVLAMAFAFFFAQAVTSRWWKWIGYGTFLLGLLGVVTSFARGAALTAAAVLLYILYRSPNRARTIGAIMLAGLLLVPLAALFVPLGDYIAELGSVSDGDDVRSELWSLTWDVFRTSPIVGVGAGNFGVIASMITPWDESRKVGADPGQLYRWAVHNVYLQILAEEGIVGIVLWFTMIGGFFARNRRLRTDRACRRWIELGGGAVDLRAISLGLEGAMFGYLVSGLFYNQLYIHWFWSLLTMVLMLGVVTDAPVPDPLPVPDTRKVGRR